MPQQELSVRGKSRGNLVGFSLCEESAHSLGVAAILTSSFLEMVALDSMTKAFAR